LVSVLCWALFVWIAIPGIFESNSLSRFFTNVAVVYLFAGAFFETCNLIKVRAEKTKPV
jgi:hypothetical protein